MHEISGCSSRRIEEGGRREVKWEKVKGRRNGELRTDFMGAAFYFISPKVSFEQASEQF